MAVKTDASTLLHRGKVDDECFNCTASASDSYTLVLSSEKVLEDTALCESCVSDFRDEDWIELRSTDSDEDDYATDG